MARSAALAEFLDAGQAALRCTTGPAAALAAEVAARWVMQGSSGAAPERLEVCDHIAPALGQYGGSLATAFAGIEGQLCWRRRLTADPAEAAFWNGHANAVILGPGGLEERPDLWIGATIMAPNITYPDHDHPPAEVYLALSPGEWWNADMDWTDPGPAGFIYNPPGIRHAMRSGDTALLALWFLPI